MDLDRILPGVIGSVVGVLGWLFVGLYIQRRNVQREQRNAARAVYFELDVNRLNIGVAREFGTFTPLTRGSFERLLPDLAAWLPVDKLQLVVAAYLGHAGYGQASADADLGPAQRRMILDALLAAHERALEVLAARLFSPAEARALEIARAGPAHVAESPKPTPAEPAATRQRG
jgi:hypothetical protein